jgi:acetyl-CoA acyltransferase
MEAAMRDAVIVEAIRTPVGKRNGGLSNVEPADLSAHTLRALVNRTGIDPRLVDDVVWGCVGQVGEQSMDIGRNAVLAAGWPESVPGVSIDRQCGSSQQALSFAAASVIAGHYEVAVAGGVESMSRVTMGSSALDQFPFGQGFRARYGPHVVPNQGIGAELIGQHWKVSRNQADEFALTSHEKAARAQDEGRFGNEIIPIVTPDGEKVVTDEGVRRGGTLETLANLRPAFKDDGIVTAANSSQISDGASATLVMTSERAHELGLVPLVRVHTCVVVGDDPIMMLTGPIPATARALQRSGLSLADIGVFEVNEAFAVVPIAWLAETGADPKRLNPNGGAIALGHPLGGSGTRLTSTLINHMRENTLRYGLQAMCEGGGQANATVFELL